MSDNVYARKVLRTQYEFALNQMFTDFKLRAGGKTVNCHRSVIAAKSEYFQAICDSRSTEAALDYTVTKEEDRNVLDSVIKYLCLGHTDITKQNVVSLVLAADFIRHNELKKQCEEYMISNINVQNLMAFQQQSEKTHLANLNEACQQFSLENFSLVVPTEWYLSLSIKEVEEYLSDDALNAVSEDEVIDAILKWLQASRASKTGKEDYMEVLMPCIRLEFCTKSKLEALSKDPYVMDMLRLTIYDYIHHGVHGGQRASRSGVPYLRASATSTSALSGTTATLSARVSRATTATTSSSATTSTSALGMKSLTPAPASETTSTLSPITSRATAATTSGTTSEPAFGRTAPGRAAVGLRSSLADQGEGKILILGGCTSKYIKNKDVLYLEKEPQGSVITQTSLDYFSVCTTEDSDSLVVSGGCNFSTGTSVPQVKKFNLTTKTWTDLPDMKHPVDLHGSTVIDNKLFTVRGVYSEKNVTKQRYPSVISLDLHTLVWSDCPPMHQAVSQQGIASIDRDILVIAGYTNIGWSSAVSKFNTQTGKWSKCQNLPKTGNIYYSAVAVQSSVFVLHSEAFLQYDVDMDQWHELTTPIKLSHVPAMVLNQRRLVTLGGYEKKKKEPNDFIQTYDLANKQWSIGNNKLPLPLQHHFAVVVKMC